MNYDVVLIEKPDIEGLTKKEIIGMLSYLKGDYAYPLEIEATMVESIAMGFITPSAANELNYIYDELSIFVANILNDMNNETSNGVYDFKDLKIKISR